MAGQDRLTRAERRQRRAAIDDPAIVLEAAARFLETRPRSVEETRRRLIWAGYRPGLVDGAVARLVELGLLDDAAFARAWIESRDRAHPRGERALRRELALKGVDRPVVDGLLADRQGPGTVAGEADERAAASLLERRRASLERVTDPRRRRERAYALLARNGFDPDVAARCAATFVEDAEA